jgi:hypothetical protein
MKPTKHDVLTVLSIGVVVYVLAKIIHEGLGHGLTCHFSGAAWLGFSSSWNQCDYGSMGVWAVRATKAAGTIANLAFGLGALLVLYARPSSRGTTFYFLWLMSAVNLLMGAGYLAVDPVFGFGDWTAFLEGLPGAAVWRWVLVATGAGLYALWVVVLLRRLRGLLGGATTSPRADAWRLCLVPYLAAGGALLTIAALFNSEGPIYALTSALATLGGTSALAWMPACVPNGPVASHGARVERSLPWVVVGALAAIFCLAFLGPGISLSGCRGCVGRAVSGGAVRSAGGAGSGDGGQEGGCDRTASRYTWTPSPSERRETAVGCRVRSWRTRNADVGSLRQGGNRQVHRGVHPGGFVCPGGQARVAGGVRSQA